MAAQQQAARKATSTEHGTGTPKPAHHGVEAIDDILEEIDAVLEDNALETVRAYRQKGGQ